MRFSNFPISTTKETPADAEVISHQLMLREALSNASLQASTPGCHWD